MRGLISIRIGPRTHIRIDPRTRIWIDPRTRIWIDPRTRIRIDPRTSSNSNNTDHGCILRVSCNARTDINSDWSADSYSD